MKECGVSPGDVVLSCLKHRMESIVPLLATLYLGAKISACCPSSTKSELAHCINSLNPKLIFTEHTCADLLLELSKNLPERPKLVVLGKSKEYSTYEDFQKPILGEKDFQPVRCENCHECAIVILSSGTLSLPKPISLSHYSLLNGTKNVA